MKKLLSNRAFAALIALIMILASIGIFGGADLRKIRSEAEKFFYEGDPNNSLDIGIQSDLDSRAEIANNLIAFAGKYINEGSAEIKATKQAIEELEKAKGPKEKFKANEELTKACSELNAKVYAQDVHEYVKDYENPSFFTSELEHYNLTISTSSGYNNKAAEFNSLVSKAPTSLVRILGGVRKLELFE